MIKVNSLLSTSDQRYQLPYGELGIRLKPCLASQHKFITYFELSFRLATYLRGLVMTCIDIGRAQIRTQVFHCLATQRNKSTQVDRKSSNTRAICYFLRPA